MKLRLLTTTTLISLSFLAISVQNPAYANPEDGTVVGGSATISENGKKLDVHQHSDRAVIDWRSFNIEIDEHTEFHQPSSTAIALNRINDINPSRIAGKLSANGNIILVNPNGVFFEGSSRVDVNGIVATTATIRAEDFMAGSNEFNSPGHQDAAIINEGIITAKDAGLVGLVAPHVENHGIIQARLGRVQLTSGDTVTVDFYGDDLLKVAVKDKNIKSQIVKNSGVLSADGGTVAMTAAAAKQTVNSLIVAEGLIEAKTIGRDANGAIIIGGEDSNKTEKSGDAYVAVSGYLDASGRNEGEQGGTIEVLGDHIAITETAMIDTSGHSAIIPERKPNSGTATMREDKRVDNGVRTEEDFLSQDSRAGGSIKIGGDYLGKGETQTSKTVKVADGAVILNNALDSGDGGRTIIWSDETTEFGGLVLSTGGTNSGHGGFLETSGKINLKATGYADLSAQDGYSNGTYLLDPDNISIYGDLHPSATTNGFNAFTTSYLEQLAENADVNLRAATSITLDLHDDMLDFTGGAAAGKSLTIQTDNGDITDASAGIIRTTRTGSGNDLNGNISLIAGGTGNITLDTTNLEALSGGVVNLYATGGNADVTQDSSLNIGTLNAQSFALETTGASNAISFTNTSGHLLGRAQAVTNTITTNNGNITFNDNLFLADNLNISAGSGDVSFSGTVDSAFFVPEPDVFSDAVIWLDANDLDGDGIPEGTSEANYNGTSVTGWADKTTNDNNGAGSTVGLGDINGNTSVVFDNNSDIVTAPDAFGGSTNDIYVFSVTQENEREQNFFFNFNGTNREADGRVSINAPWPNGVWYWDAGSAFGGRSGIGGNPTKISDVTQATFFSSVSENQRGIRLNSGAQSVVNTGANSLTTSGGLLIGHFNDTPGNIELAEIIAFDRVLNHTEVVIIEKYLADKWQNGIMLGEDYNLSVSGENVAFNVNAGSLQALNDISIIAQGAVTLQDINAGSIDIRSGTTSDVTFNGNVEATDSGNALIVSAGRNFINLAGASALNVTDAMARWLVYSTDPRENAMAGITPDFKRYNRTFSGNAPGTISETGNGLIYSVAPVLTYDVVDLTVEYGEELHDLSANYVAGLIDGDDLTTIGQMGSPTLSTSYVPGLDSNIYTGDLTGTTEMFTNLLGYEYDFNAGDLTVTQADLNISVDPAVETINQGEPLPSYNLSYGPFKLADTFTDLDVLPTITVPSNNVVGSFPVTLSGGSDNNYNYILSNGILEILALVATNNNVTIPSTVEEDFSTRLLGNRFDNQKLNIPVRESRSLPDSQIDIEIEGISEEQSELNVTEEKKRKIKLKIDKDLSNQLNLQINDGVL